ncbi:hypothetical protein AB0M54_32505 [Actinoplanes sp. NPDC051470]|uniref:hypothetical protein n=1 Tax=Actinoplanes sp. NPDC051470 TaxID=3157224 RepID=UPI0034405450
MTLSPPHPFPSSGPPAPAGSSPAPFPPGSPSALFPATSSPAPFPAEEAIVADAERLSAERRGGRSLGSLLAEHLAAVEAEQADPALLDAAPVPPALGDRGTDVSPTASPTSLPDASPFGAAPTRASPPDASPFGASPFGDTPPGDTRPDNSPPGDAPPGDLGDPVSVAPAAGGWTDSAWDDDRRIALAGGPPAPEPDFSNLWKDDDRVALDDDPAGRSWRKPWRRRRRDEHSAEVDTPAAHEAQDVDVHHDLDPTAEGDPQALTGPQALDEPPTGPEASALWPRPSVRPIEWPAHPAEPATAADDPPAADLDQADPEQSWPDAAEREEPRPVLDADDLDAVAVLPVAVVDPAVAGEDGRGRWAWPPSGVDAATPAPKSPAEEAAAEAAEVAAADQEPVGRSVVELAERLGDDLVDASDVVAEIGRMGVDDDDEARRRYGMSLQGVGVSVLTHLEQRRAQRGARRAPAKRPYVGTALVRCALYVGPLSVAVAGLPVLGRLGWLVPTVLVLLGWSAAQALTSVGAEVARGAGAAPAARLVGGGFLAAGGVWSALVWVAPDALLGGSRMLAFMVGLGGLATLATVTAALVTRTEADVVRWSLPCWLLGALSVAATLGDGWTAGLPLGTLLPAAIVVAAVRAYRPVIMRRVPGRPRLERGAVWRGLGHLVLGAAQAGTAVLLWRAGPDGSAVLAMLPLLVAVPALETLVGWHLHEVEAGLDLAESERDYRRHVRSVAVTTVSALLPPLAAGVALTAAAYRLPQGRDGVLTLAAGTLLGGLLAITFLLAARRRTATAASLAAAAPLAILTLPLLAKPLPSVVAVLAATHLLGLLLVAYTSADQKDHRRSS